MSDRDLFLGKLLDKDEQLRLDPDDLTTHAVIVGMTGSGKTGLGIVLLEEALARGIPALILDPKGDMGNLALTFPDLAAASFEPWIDESTARDAGLSVGEYAEQTATRWKEGLAASGIGPERIQALRDAAEVTLYTPGSEAGVPLNVIGSLDAPTLSWDEDEETIRDEIEGTVTSLLGLVGIDADPLGSREHVLIANLLEHSWRAGKSLDLGSLINQIQTPPLRKLGVFDVDTFMPPKERTELAMRLNALVASPSFAAWGRGPALDPRVLLRTEEGKPRAAVIYLAHLSDQERQLVVTLVLSRLITWMHEQPGTSELRALVYLDEVFGFAPPTAAPPSKKPILTLMKQARAFGIGMVVATQNPVDLDYKAMANAGSWFIGRLQTENDKARVLEGLRSAAGGVDVGKLDKAIGGLEQRQFLLQSAHRAEPVLFSTRWAMSFLRGPLTKDQIEILTPDEAKAAPGAEGVAAEPAAPAAPTLADDESAVAPAVASGATVRYLDPAAPWAASVGATPDGKRLQAFLAARVSLRYDDTKAALDTSQEWEALYGPLDAGIDLDDETAVDYDERDFRSEPPAGATYVLSGRSARQGVILQGCRPRDPTPGDRHADPRAPPLRRARPLLAARRDERAVRGARRRGRAGGRGRRGGKDPRPARGEARPARAGSRGGAPEGRGGGQRADLAPVDRAPLRPGKRRRRPPGRQGEHTHDRARRPGARRCGVTPRHDHQSGRAQAHRRGAGRRQRGGARAARAGAARRGRRDRRALEGEGRPDRDDRDPTRDDGRARARDHARLGADGLTGAFAVRTSLTPTARRAAERRSRSA